MFVDLTDVLRSRVGRAGAVGVLGVMEARSAEVIATLLDRPELAVTRRSPLPAARRVGRIALRYRIPAAVVGGRVRPRAGPGTSVRPGPRRPATPCPRGRGRPGRTLERVRWMLTDRFVRCPRGPHPRPWPGSSRSAWPPACSAVTRRPGELGTVLRGLPHNVTTEMDLALWDLAVRLRETPPPSPP